MRVDELALLAATLVEYLRWCADSGLDAADAAPQVTLRLSVGTQVFPQVAKLRAARLLWRACLGASGIESPAEPRLHVVGSRRSLTHRARELNLLRATEQAFIALAGGAEAVSLWPHDIHRGSSSDLAHRLARNVPLVLEYEAELGSVGDPAAGSYAVEHLTRELAERAWEEAQKIERSGGLRRALLSGEIGERIASAASERTARFEAGFFGITGVTDYVHDDEHEAPAAPAEPPEGAARLERHRTEWTPSDRSTSYSSHFVIEELVGLARGGATVTGLGERLGGAEGAEQIEPLPLRRDATPFEQVGTADGEDE